MVSLIIFIIFIYSVIIHEVAHGYTAYLLGDDTAYRYGRLTLNPIPHIDFFYTIVLPIILFMTSPIIFGAAKPVPVNDFNFYNRKKGISLVSLAGPLSNISIAIVAGLIMHILSFMGIEIIFIIKILYYTIVLNIVLALLNLLPIPPLDGSKVIAYFLPDEYLDFVHRVGLSGFLIIFLFLYMGLFNKIYSLIAVPFIKFLAGI